MLCNALNLTHVFLDMCRSAAASAPVGPLRGPRLDLYPVSVSFEPPFTALVNLVGHGDRQAGMDVSHVLSTFGSWQPGLNPGRKPSVVDALTGALGSRTRRLGLADVGAGHGFFSLAAAARGRHVHAFEVSAASLAAFQASIRYNGFDGLINLRNVSLGARTERICLRRAEPFDAVDAADVHLRRGYGDPRVHDIRSPAQCASFGLRTTLSQLLGEDGSIGAVRLSANGHEGGPALHNPLKVNPKYRTCCLQVASAAF